MVRRVASGFTGYFQGLRFWSRHSQLVRLSIIPFFIYVAFLVVGLGFAIGKIPETVNYVISRPEVWYQYIFYYLLMVATGLAFFFITLFLVSVISRLIAFPFNDALAEKTLLLNKVLTAENWSFKAWASKSAKNFGAMLGKTLVLLLVGAVLVVAALLPGLGIVAGAVGMFILAWDMMDFSFDHFQMPFTERRHFIRRNLPEMIGFTGAMALTMAIPVLNMLALPGSVVAAACLFSKVKQLESGR